MLTCCSSWRTVVPVSERYCIRGCTVRGEHYATCVDYGKPPEESKCRGCAPRECRDGSLICNRCFGRLRALVRNSGDLMGRLHSLADPMKATPTDKAPGGRSASVEPPAPVDADILDAINEISRRLWDWETFVHPQTLEAALSQLVNVVDHVEALGRGFLDRHPLVDGIREVWSVQDAVDKWGLERRVETKFVYPADDTEDVELQPVREWFDQLLTLQQAAKRAKVSQRQVQRWVAKEILPVATRHRGPRGSVVKYVYSSAVDAASEQMRANQRGSQFATAAPTTKHEIGSRHADQ